jgi:fused signal recognition particle receptor
VFRESLHRTRQVFQGRIATLIGTSELNDDTWDELEAMLVQADLGVHTALTVTSQLRKRVQSEGIATREQFELALRETLVALLPDPPAPSLDRDRLLNIILVVGVNGSGKTTTIAKLARHFVDDDWKVMLAAADTFRAAAIEQLQTWGERLSVPVIAGQIGSDPGAVTYDAIRAARARGYNLLIVDTAGRLHTKFNLMEELKKVRRVAEKNVHLAPHEVWLVVDGTTGQNALAQAKHFQQDVGVTGAIVTKLDSSAKGGMVFAIGHELALPIRYVGVGEGLDGLLPFDSQAFVDGMLT